MCFDYYDTPEFYNSRVVKCRKPHKCGGCKVVIAAGDKSQLSTGKFDGAMFAIYACEDCQRLTYSIAALEIERGCHWIEAWCPIEEVRSYAKESEVRMLQGTLDECWTQVNESWTKACERRKHVLHGG